MRLLNCANGRRVKVQAITVAIDQYAEKALGNRDYYHYASPADNNLRGLH